MLKVIEFCCKS